MKQQVNPVLVAVVLVVVVAVVVFFGYRALGPKKYEAEKTGGEAEMKKYEQTGTFYQPPAGVVPGSNQPGSGPPPAPR